MLLTSGPEEFSPPVRPLSLEIRCAGTHGDRCSDGLTDIEHPQHEERKAADGSQGWELWGCWSVVGSGRDVAQAHRQHAAGRGWRCDLLLELPGLLSSSQISQMESKRLYLKTQGSKCSSKFHYFSPRSHRRKQAVCGNSAEPNLRTTQALKLAHQPISYP